MRTGTVLGAGREGAEREGTESRRTVKIAIEI